jgi:hypothetical protein
MSDEAVREECEHGVDPNEDGNCEDCVALNHRPLTGAKLLAAARKVVAHPGSVSTRELSLARAVLEMAEQLSAYRESAYELLDAVELDETSRNVESSYGRDTYSAERYAEVRKRRGEQFGINVDAYRRHLDAIERGEHVGQAAKSHEKKGNP